MKYRTALLKGYYTRGGLAKELGRSERTLERWEVQRTGPPITYIGRTPYYKIESVEVWLKGLEKKPARRSCR